MPQVVKIDSNITGLAFAEEASIGFLPGEGGFAGTPEWYRLNPNSYADFGGEIVTVAPNPINPSRQRRKGVTTGLNAMGGFNQNLTFSNLSKLMQGVIFADIREKGTEAVTAVDVSGDPDLYEVASTTGFLVGSLVKGSGFTSSVNNGIHVVTAISADVSVGIVDAGLIAEASPPAAAKITVVGVQGAAGDLDVVVSGDLPVITSSVLNFTTLGIIPGQWIFIGGDIAAHSFVAAANNGFKRVRAVTANALTLDKSFLAMSAEASGSETIRIFFGDVLKNETGALIRRRSYNVERTLGAPDTDQPSQIQSEVLKGAVPSEFTLNVPSADLLSVDFAFMAIDNEQRSGVTGPKQTGVLNFPASQEYNTSSDVGRIRLSTVSSLDEAPVALFAYATEISIAINNNLQALPAIGVLGAFDVSAGTFTVSGSLTVYFANIAATQAVRTNADITLDISFIKDNAGIVFDLPFTSLGDGRLNVEIDQAITLPLTLDAASALDLGEDLDHTLCITYFNYLPEAAE